MAVLLSTVCVIWPHFCTKGGTPTNPINSLGLTWDLQLAPYCLYTLVTTKETTFLVRIFHVFQWTCSKLEHGITRKPGWIEQLLGNVFKTFRNGWILVEMLSFLLVVFPAQTCSNYWPWKWYWVWGNVTNISILILIGLTGNGPENSVFFLFGTDSLSLSYCKWQMDDGNFLSPGPLIPLPHMGDVQSEVPAHFAALGSSQGCKVSRD